MHNVAGGGEFQIYRHILKWDNFNSFILQNFKSCINTPITSLCILSFPYHSLRFDLEHGSTNEDEILLDVVHQVPYTELNLF